MKRNSVVILIIFFVFCGTVSGGWKDDIDDFFKTTAPSVGMSFLKIGTGARAIALGGAYSSVVADPTAVYWNPVGVIYTEGLDASFSHLALMEGVNYEFFALSTGDGKQGIGIGLGGVFYGSMELRDDRPSEEPIGEFKAYSFLGKIAYGRQFGEDFAAGFSMGGVLERIYVYSTRAYTLDFGLRYYPHIVDNLTLSLNFNNLGPKVIYLDETFRLPLTTKFGSSFTFNKWNSDMTLSTEVSKSIDTPLSSSFGMEVGFSFINLRAGYAYGNDSALGWSAGVGIEHSFVSVDYSFSPYLMDLGIKQCISLNMDF